MVNWKWMWMICLQLIDLCIVVENEVNVVYVELMIGILRYVDDLSYWDCGLEIMEMDWNDELCELFVFDGDKLVV